jgi:hypothetical protein
MKASAKRMDIHPMSPTFDNLRTLSILLLLYCERVQTHKVRSLHGARCSDQWPGKEKGWETKKLPEEGSLMGTRPWVSGRILGSSPFQAREARPFPVVPNVRPSVWRLPFRGSGSENFEYYREIP